MGFLVNSLNALRTHLKLKEFQIHAILLATNDQSFDNFDFARFIGHSLTVTGQNIACIYQISYHIFRC